MVRGSSIHQKIRIFAYVASSIFTILIIKVFWIYGKGTFERIKLVKSSNIEDSTPFRHQILDRNGNILAISVPAYEYHINPSFIIDINLVIQKIIDVFPDLNRETLYERLSSGTNGWFLIRSNVTPQEKEKIIENGIEGSFFEEHYTRFYPYGNLFSHIVGYTKKDGNKESGFKGIEMSMNKELFENNITLSLDATIQSVIHQKLTTDFEKFEANGAFAILIDLETREIISSVSLPDFNPMATINPREKSQVDIPFSSVFNLGSVFKIFTAAIGLENGFTRTQMIHLPQSIFVTSNFSVTDEHRTRDIMTLDEIIAFSSNVGVATIIQKAGFEAQRKFFEKVQMFEKPKFDLPAGEIAKPLYVSGKWKESMHYTTSYGYGISLTPAHFLQIVSGLVYDGKIIPLQLIKGKTITKEYKMVVKPETIVSLQAVMRSVVEIGTAQRATINGYSICGKTGTSLKFDRQTRKWINTKKFLSFISIFPCDKPKYAMYVGIDEPTKGYVQMLQASNTAVATTSEIIKVVAPMLNARPDKENGKYQR